MTIEMAKVKTSTVPSSAIASSRGMLPGLIVRTTCSATWAIDQPGGAAEQAEQHALGQQLADESLPARAERRADRDFLLPAGRAREQQIGDVGARDQQHERHRAEHDEHRDADVADDGLDERDDVDRERAVAFVFLANARGDRRHVVLRLRHRHARLQPRHQVVVLVAAPR